MSRFTEKLEKYRRSRDPHGWEREVEANRFAIALLMPSPRLRRATVPYRWPLSAKSVQALAYRFKVDRRLMLSRLIELHVPVELT